MIKIFIGKRDYRYTLKVLLEFINNKTSRELTYSTNDMVGVDVYVYVTELFSSSRIREHSEELPQDIIVHIADGLGIYVDGEIVSIDELEDYIERM
ncbi:TreE [Staphylococcus phage vB_Sau_Clo6]|nr:TreE [Staphylococcus phage vB_Sau_Clo6]